jgi:hypothetical protein
MQFIYLTLAQDQAFAEHYILYGALFKIKIWKIIGGGDSKLTHSSLFPTFRNLQYTCQNKQHLSDCSAPT